MSATGRRNADEALLVSLATGATAEEASRAAGVGIQTVYRRLKTPEFADRLNDLKGRGLEHAVAQMGSMSGKAVEALEELLGAKSETARLGAARSVIELGLKLREAVELEQRLRALEAAQRGEAPRPLHGRQVS